MWSTDVVRFQSASEHTCYPRLPINASALHCLSFSPVVLLRRALLCIPLVASTSFASPVGARSLTPRQLPLCACVHASFALGEL